MAQAAPIAYYFVPSQDGEYSLQQAGAAAAAGGGMDALSLMLQPSAAAQLEHSAGALAAAAQQQAALELLRVRAGVVQQPHSGDSGDDSATAGARNAGRGVPGVNPPKGLKEKNREAQRRFRARQKVLVTSLKTDMDALQMRVAKQDQEIACLREENSVLRQLLNTAQHAAAAAAMAAAHGNLHHPGTVTAHQQQQQQQLFAVQAAATTTNSGSNNHNNTPAVGLSGLPANYMLPNTTDGGAKHSVGGSGLAETTGQHSLHSSSVSNLTVGGSTIYVQQAGGMHVLQLPAQLLQQQLAVMPLIAAISQEQQAHHQQEQNKPLQPQASVATTATGTNNSS